MGWRNKIEAAIYIFEKIQLRLLELKNVKIKLVWLLWAYKA